MQWIDSSDGVGRKTNYEIHLFAENLAPTSIVVPIAMTTIQVTQKDIDKAVALYREKEGIKVIDGNYCPIAIALARHRKKKIGWFEVGGLALHEATISMVSTVFGKKSKSWPLPEKARLWANQFDASLQRKFRVGYPNELPKPFSFELLR